MPTIAQDVIPPDFHPFTVENWRKAMEQAHQIALQKASKASTKGKRQFDKKARAVLLKPAW